MFWNNKESKLESEKADLKKVIEALESDKKGLKEEVGDLKLKKKMEEEDIKHMVKIDRERKDIQIEKEKIQLEGEQAKAIAKVKDEYQDKTEAQLKEQLSVMKGMYGEILERLPNYNVEHTIKQTKK